MRLKDYLNINKMQLTSYENITQDNIIFNDSKEYKVKDSKIKYKRIPIEIKYTNKKKGPLVIETPVLFSFGVNEKKNQDTKKVFFFFFLIIYLRHFIITLLTYKAYRYMITLLLYSNYLTVQIYNTE